MHETGDWAAGVWVGVLAGRIDVPEITFRDAIAVESAIVRAAAHHQAAAWRAGSAPNRWTASDAS